MIFFWQRSALGYFLAGEEWKLSVQRDQASNWITFDFRLLDYKSEIVSDQRFRQRNVANFGFNLRPLLKSVDTFNCRIICSRSRRGSWSRHAFWLLSMLCPLSSHVTLPTFTSHYCLSEIWQTTIQSQTLKSQVASLAKSTLEKRVSLPCSYIQKQIKRIRMDKVIPPPPPFRLRINKYWRTNIKSQQKKGSQSYDNIK